MGIIGIRQQGGPVCGISKKNKAVIVHRFQKQSESVKSWDKIRNVSKTGAENVWNRGGNEVEIPNENLKPEDLKWVDLVLATLTNMGNFEKLILPE